MADALLELRNISKSFPGVQALDDVSFSVCPGEVHALLGENGAGKSTLIKIMSGAYPSDKGEIWWKGQRIVYNDPLHALELGIGAIYQEFNLVPQLNVAQNILLGQFPTTRWGSVDNAELHRRASDALKQFDFHLDTRLMVSQLNIAQQQIVEIAKALIRDLRILIMDEPTAALNNVEIAHLFEVIRKLKARGVAIVYISHRLREIFEIADTITVLKDGKLVGTKALPEVTEDSLITMMVGRTLADRYPPKDTVQSEIILKVEHLSLDGALNDVSLQVRKGEILGVAGLEGQGQRDLVRAITGAVRATSGAITVDGERQAIHSPHDAIRSGIAYIPDDRKNEGLVLMRSVRENIALPSLFARLRSLFMVDEPNEQRFVRQLVDRLGIKASSPMQVTRNLSGGNQQKVVVAKWLGTNPKVMVVAEPTRGIDVGSKSEIHHLMRELARQGVGILMVSSELPEILGMSDRIVVMSRGQIVAEMSGAEATEEAIMSAATRGISSTVSQSVFASASSG
jgi:ribose transport system ATP-binding protein